MSAKKLARNGKPVSRRTDQPSDNSAANAKLEGLLAAVYPKYQKRTDSAADRQCRKDFVFHMTDWAGDLQRLAALYREPQDFAKTEAEAIVAGFLYHVIPHLVEAGRLLLDYEPGFIFESPKPRRRKTHSVA